MKFLLIYVVFCSWSLTFGGIDGIKTNETNITTRTNITKYQLKTASSDTSLQTLLDEAEKVKTNTDEKKNRKITPTSSQNASTSNKEQPDSKNNNDSNNNMRTPHLITNETMVAEGVLMMNVTSTQNALQTPTPTEAAATSNSTKETAAEKSMNVIGSNSTTPPAASASDNINITIPANTNASNVTIKANTILSTTTTTTTTTATTTSTATTPKPKKPSITISVEDAPNLEDNNVNVESNGVKRTQAAASNTSKFPTPPEPPNAEPSQEFNVGMGGGSLTAPSYSDSSYMVPLIIVLFTVPLAIGVVITSYRRFRDFWSTRHYRRMDFLVDGMYND